MDGIPSDLLTRAEAGDANSQFEVAALFQTGKGVPQDYEAAMRWCLLAAEQGHSRAQFNIGSFYLHGLVVDSDPVVALRWYERAASHGDPELLYNIAHVVEKANEHFNAWSFAVQCYQAAADAGYAEAQCSLGIKVLTGRGIEQDVKRGLTYLLQAADQQHVDSWILLGHLHAEGQFWEPDRATGLYYLRMAEGRGHAQAKQWADELHDKMTPEERSKTDELLEKAAELGRRYEQERRGQK